MAFASEEKGGDFWDTHSTADYEEYLTKGEASADGLAIAP